MWTRLSKTETDQNKLIIEATSNLVEALDALCFLVVTFMETRFSAGVTDSCGF